jgi:hypothetical protein
VEIRRGVPGPSLWRANDWRIAVTPRHGPRLMFSVSGWLARGRLNVHELPPNTARIIVRRVPITPITSVVLVVYAKRTGVPPYSSWKRGGSSRVHDPGHQQLPSRGGKAVP